jgi:alpha-L-fucosidase
MMMKRTVLLLVLILGCFSSFEQVFAQTAIGTYAGNRQKLEEWKDNHFGMFIHWGPVSLTGKEISWSRGSQTPIDVYDHLYERFNPVKFNADEWVSLAKAAGMKYIVLTTKHHDGFCLWNTRQTDYNIMHSPFKRDIVKELSEACKKQGIEFGTYYSTCDWHNPDFPLTSPGGKVKREKSDLEAYTSYLKRQVSELLVNYGPLYTLWFDVPQMFDKQRGQNVIDFIRGLQPDIIINNRLGAPGDFDTPEQRIGGFNNQRPWETCMTIAQQWSWKPNDKVKTLEQCLQTLIRTVGGDGNLLFNVGPNAEGVIEPEQVARLKEMGNWLSQYGQSVYGTRGGPFKPTDWGVSTRKGNKIYLHILTSYGNDFKVELPNVGIAIKDAHIINGRSVKIQKKGSNYLLEISKKDLKPIDTIVELEMAGDVMNVTPLDVKPLSLLYGKTMTASSVSSPQWYGIHNINNGDWSGKGWSPSSNEKRPWVEASFDKPYKISKAILYEGGRHSVKAFEIQCFSDSKWKTVYKGNAIGSRLDIKLPPTHAEKVKILFTEFSQPLEISEVVIF